MEHKLLLDKTPDIHEKAFVAEGAVLIGDVTIEEEASVWFNCVLRGDVNRIRIGKRSNIQDLSICHGMINRYPVLVGDGVTVGHAAILHGCVVEDNCLIGMGAKILNGAVIGAGSIVAAGSVVTERTIVPPNSFVAGLPAKIKKTIGKEELELIAAYNANYLSYTRTYREL